MQKAEIILAALRKLGEDNQPIERVYRQLYNENLYLAAYAKLFRNKGALTKGTQEETIDGMNLNRIRKIIEEIRNERFKFTPARRMWIDKKNGKKRPLGIPNFKDKLVQEVLRGLLEAYYEPRFSNNSHGFRPSRGCHTALAQVRQQFKGAAWYIEGDIRGCFDNIDHTILMDILSRNIHDNRLLNLIKQGLNVGFMEGWQYRQTYSGTPQGAILSPLLANVFLNDFDQFVETELMSKWNRGEKRRPNPLNRTYEGLIQKAKKRHDVTELRRLVKARRQCPSKDTHDPDYRRLKYVRYADDFILGFAGTQAEALEIKNAIGEFLKHRLNLTLSDEKTLITQARKEKALFLGYHISTHQENTKLCNTALIEIGRYKRRSINGSVRLGIPFGLAKEKAKRFMAIGKPSQRLELQDRSVAEILITYQTEFRGLVEYYKYAEDINALGSLKYVMEQSLMKTLAHKLKITVAAAYRKYRTTITVAGQSYVVIQETIDTDNGKKTFTWGGIPLKRWRGQITRPIDNQIHTFKWSDRSDLVTRLQRGKCEICGSDENIQVHHIRKLKDLKERWRGRKEKPEWVTRMIALQRKTLVVCERCHRDIHRRSGKVTLPNAA